MLPKSIENSRVWQKFGDLFCVLFITILLLAIYIPVHNIYSPSWVIGIYSFASFDLLAAPTQPDIDGKFVGDASFVLLTITDWSYGLSIITTGLAAFFVATNDQLTLPIRLLATAENLTKLAFSMSYFLNECCYLPIANIQCSEQVRFAFSNIYDYSIFFDLTNIAQYCQLLISLSRFLALSCDGIYFRYTLKYPFLQLLFPYLFGVFITYLSVFAKNVFDFYASTDYNTIPYFLMCGLDFMTNWNMRKKSQKSDRVTRAESMLMIQMIANCIFNLTTTIVSDGLVEIFHIFYGPNFLSFLQQILLLIRIFLFFFVNSLISMYCFWTPKRRVRGKSILVSSLKN